jgi:cysteine-rich repeat protein
VNCTDSGGTQTVNDIWYTYTATCNGLLTVTTCSDLGGNSNYDSDLVLYPGNAACPPPANTVIACNDDDTGHPCGSAPPWSSTLTTQVTSGSTYILRVGGWANTTDRGTGVVNITCQVAVCGNGVVEAGEQCDDGNNIPGDGCTNCQIDPNCTAACTLTEPEACGADTNGGCNSTPEAFTNVSNGTVVCGESWADNNQRDTDWYHVTVGASGRVEIHLQSLTNLSHVVSIGTGTCANLILPASADSELMACAVAVASGLTPGSTATIVVVPGTTDFGIFNGFPCGGGHGYKMRVVSP